MEVIAISSILLAIIGTGATVIGCIYAFMRNFKADITKQIDELKAHNDIQDQRMFYLATGRTLADAMKDEKNK